MWAVTPDGEGTEQSIGPRCLAVWMWNVHACACIVSGAGPLRVALGLALCLSSSGDPAGVSAAGRGGAGQWPSQ